MNVRIVYPNDEGGVSIITPTNDLTVEQTALKDVPAGVPYVIVDTSEIPKDRFFRNAWEADFSNPDGYGIGAEAWFAGRN